MAASYPNVTEEDLNGFRFSVDQILTIVEKLEKQVNEVEQFYESINFQVNNSKDKGQEKHFIGTKNPLQDASQTKADAAKGTQELMRQFSAILRQITQHKWAWPFLKPVDVEGLGLHDYYEERRHLEEEAHVQLDKQLAQEATYANMATDLTVALDEVDMHLRSLKALVIQKCRKLSAQEKVLLGTALPRLSPKYLTEALQIVSENNPTFQSTGQEVDFDIDAQNDYTLWRLNVFVKHALDVQGRTAGGKAVNHNNNIEDKNNSKRRRIL